MRRSFEEVWYLPRKNALKEFNFLAYRDIGTLVVEDGQITFTGRRYKTQITETAELSYGRQGRDFINKWVGVRPTGGEWIYFADGHWLGWRGILGGTKAIFQSASEAFADRSAPS